MTLAQRIAARKRELALAAGSNDATVCVQQMVTADCPRPHRYGPDDLPRHTARFPHARVTYGWADR